MKSFFGYVFDDIPWRSESAVSNNSFYIVKSLYFFLCNIMRMNLSKHKKHKAEELTNKIINHDELQKSIVF